MTLAECTPGTKVKVPTKKNTGVSSILNFQEERAKTFPNQDFMYINRIEYDKDVIMQPIGSECHVYRFLPSDLEPYENKAEDLFGNQEEEMVMNGTPIPGTNWKVGDAVKTPKGYEDKISPQFGSLFIKDFREKDFGADLILTSDPIHHTDEVGVFYHTDLEPYSLTKKKDPFQPIGQVLEGIETLLRYKNGKYGNSALEPLGVFSKQSSKAKILARMDDKLARIKNSEEVGKNDLVDLIGYGILLCAHEGWNDFTDLQD